MNARKPVNHKPWTLTGEPGVVAEILGDGLLATGLHWSSFRDQEFGFRDLVFVELGWGIPGQCGWSFRAFVLVM